MDVFLSKFMYPISTNQINKSSLNRIASEPAIPNEKRAHILYASVLDFFFRVCVCSCFYSLAPKSIFNHVVERRISVQTSALYRIPFENVLSSD